MEPHVEHTLEFDALKEMVASFAVSSLGSEDVRALRALDDLARLEQEFALIRELMRLLAEDDAPPINGLKDPRPVFQRLHPENAMLEPSELLDIAHFLEVVGRTRQFFSRKRAEAPNCFLRFNQLEWLSDIQKDIEEKISEKAELRDNASNVLQTLRREIHSTEEQIHRQIEDMIQHLQGESILQDNYFTVRNNRYVLPVRAGSRGKLKGIVQGASHSGETLFIEPFELVEITNQLAELHIKEKEEMRKILLALSNKVRQHVNALTVNTTLMQQLDSLYARARFAFKHSLSIPQISLEGPLALRKAHHPLLYVQASEQSVPLDILMRTTDKVLVISGPNAGGKTTALKNIGLNVLMVQSAIPVPCAPDSRFPLFERVFADIGDEQNVTEGVSTFSAHMRNIVQILMRMREKTLVLLDELGAATDPTQGSALAVAILEELARRGAATFTTSHLPALKHWAHSFLGARNASFRLDEQTHRPSFTLTMDIPGISEAFIIAVAEGIPSQIIERAREQLGSGEENLNALIISLQEKEQALLKRLESAEELRQAADADKKRYHELFEAVEKEKRTLRREMLEEKEHLLAEARRVIEHKIAHLPSKDDLLRARKEIEQMMREAREQEAALAEEPPPSWKLDQLRPGQKVYVSDMHEEAVLRELDAARNTARVLLGDVEVEVPLHKLEIIEEKTANKLPQYPGIRYEIKTDVPHKLDLHGVRVEEALEKIDKYLDDAVIADLSSVKLVHGYGTGALRQAIHEFLKHHDHVKSSRSGITEEGGDAVTIVELK